MPKEKAYNNDSKHSTNEDMLATISLFGLYINACYLTSLKVVVNRRNK